MRSVATAISNALTARDGLVIRDFVWVEGKNRSTGVTETLGLWSDNYAATVNIISGKNRQTTARTYYPGYGLVSVSPIPLVSDLTIQQVRISLSQIDDNAELAIRGYEPRQAWVEIHRGLFSTSTRELLAPPEPHFVGRIDKAIINTPAEGQSGTIELTCSDDLREMTRTNPARKSHEQQKRRSVDLFRQYNTTAAEWQIYWGEAKPSRSQDPGPDGTRPGADG